MALQASEAPAAPAVAPAVPQPQKPAQPIQPEDTLCGLREVMWAVGAAALVVAAGWLARRWATLPSGE